MLLVLTNYVIVLKCIQIISMLSHIAYTVLRCVTGVVLTKPHIPITQHTYIISRLIVQKNSRACAVLTLRIIWLQKSSSGLFLQRYVFILSVVGRWWNVWHRAINLISLRYISASVYAIYSCIFLIIASSIIYTCNINFIRKIRKNYK